MPQLQRAPCIQPNTRTLECSSNSNLLKVRRLSCLAIKTQQLADRRTRTIGRLILKSSAGRFKLLFSRLEDPQLSFIISMRRSDLQLTRNCRVYRLSEVLRSVMLVVDPLLLYKEIGATRVVAMPISHPRRKGLLMGFSIRGCPSHP